MILDKLVFTHTIPDFQQVKPEILRQISQMGTHSAVDANQQIANTDWYIKDCVQRTYLEPIKGALIEAFQTLRQEVFGILPNTPTISNYWFQQYGPGDFQAWHHHAHAAYVANVFVELAAGAETQFMVNSELKTVSVEEGQILFFPAMLPHRSPPNNTGVRKTSIAINISM
jgi:hypothetical protein